MDEKLNHIKEMKLRLVSSQNRELEKLIKKVRKELRIPLSKTAIIKIAIYEFLKNNETNNDLKRVLEKYQYI